MSIFKREQEPPHNRGAATRAAAGPAAQARETAAPAMPTAATSATPPYAAAPTSVPSAQAPAPPSVAREAAAVVDRKTEITGTLHSSGNVLIEGRFHGEVEANETVWVENGAQSDGQLRASAAVISGTVDGQIACAERLQITTSAVVNGEIKTPILVIEEGATVNCRFSMSRADTRYGGK